MTVGDAWKVGGQIDWGAVALSVTTAAELGLSPRTNYKFFPVIKGQVFPMAEICRVLLFRHGGDLEVTKDTNLECTVVVTGPNGQRLPALHRHRRRSPKGRLGQSLRPANLRPPGHPAGPGHHAGHQTPLPPSPRRPTPRQVGRLAQ